MDSALKPLMAKTDRRYKLVQADEQELKAAGQTPSDVVAVVSPTRSILFRRVDLRHRFEQLRVQWEESTAHHSLLAQKAAHPTYRAVVALGEDMVAVLLEEIAAGRLEWSPALSELTGYAPERDLPEVTYEGIRQAWFAWADNNPGMAAPASVLISSTADGTTNV